MAVTVPAVVFPATPTCSPTLTSDKEGDATERSRYVVDDDTFTVTVVVPPDFVGSFTTNEPDPTETTVPNAAGGAPCPRPPGPKRPGPKPAGRPMKTDVAATAPAALVPETLTTSPTLTAAKDGEATPGSRYVVDEDTFTVVEPFPRSCLTVNVPAPTEVTVPKAAGGDPPWKCPPSPRPGVAGADGLALANCSVEAPPDGLETAATIPYAPPPIPTAAAVTTATKRRRFLPRAASSPG